MKSNRSLVSAMTAIAFINATYAVQATPKTVQGSWQGTFSVRNSAAIIDSCDNSGSQITLNGTVMTVGGIVTKITASNNMKGTKSYSVLGQAQVDLKLSDNAPKSFNKQGSLADGVGGNPWIGFYYTNPPVESDVVLGRCVQGVKKGIDADGIVINALQMTLSTSECSPSKTTADHYFAHSSAGVNGNIILSNSTNNTQHEASAEGILAASVVNLDRQMLTGGNTRSFAGGNPHIYLEAWVAKRNANGALLVKADGTLEADTSKPVAFSNLGAGGYAGRCRDLMK